MIEDVYTLLLWIIPGAIAVRVKNRLVAAAGTRGPSVSEIDLMVTYVIASVPVYGLVKAVGWLGEDVFHVVGFSMKVVASKAVFVVVSWPVAVVVGLGFAVAT